MSDAPPGYTEEEAAAGRNRLLESQPRTLALPALGGFDLLWDGVPYIKAPSSEEPQIVYQILRAEMEPNGMGYVLVNRPVSEVAYMARESAQHEIDRLEREELDRAQAEAAQEYVQRVEAWTQARDEHAVLVREGYRTGPHAGPIPALRVVDSPTHAYKIQEVRLCP